MHGRTPDEDVMGYRPSVSVFLCRCTECPHMNEVLHMYSVRVLHDSISVAAVHPSVCSVPAEGRRAYAYAGRVTGTRSSASFSFFAIPCPTPTFPLLPIASSQYGVPPRTIMMVLVTEPWSSPYMYFVPSSTGQHDHSWSL